MTEKQLFDTIGKSSDFIVKKLPVDKGPSVLIACMEGLSDKDLMDRDIVAHIMSYRYDPNARRQFSDYLKDKLISTCSTKEINDFGEVVVFILSGDAILFTDGLTSLNLF
ncbi:spore germination protein [Caproicibacter sp. BJN0012]|uniref:spore germination protein n=1 Tax=Caproicibacter sp. BJN0012 TaxID=3110227 RepID=UPI002E0EA222|nr:spore germination protein [Caproicibacter sp. BJN0012]